MGTTSGWVKTTPFGDYKDSIQNGKVGCRNTPQYNFVHCMINNNRKHSGSKNLHVLRTYK